MVADLFHRSERVSAPNLPLAAFRVRILLVRCGVVGASVDFGYIPPLRHLAPSRRRNRSILGVGENLSASNCRLCIGGIRIASPISASYNARRRKHAFLVSGVFLAVEGRRVLEERDGRVDSMCDTGGNIAVRYVPPVDGFRPGN